MSTAPWVVVGVSCVLYDNVCFLSFQVRITGVTGGRAFRACSVDFRKCSLKEFRIELPVSGVTLMTPIFFVNVFQT